MKRLVATAVVVLSFLPLAPTARADELPGGLKVTHLDDSGARPDRAQVLSAKHYFEVHVAGSCGFCGEETQSLFPTMFSRPRVDDALNQGHHAHFYCWTQNHLCPCCF